MTNINLKATAYIVITLSIITWIALIIATEDSLILSFIWCYKIPHVITINFFIWTIFIKWGWKLKIFQKWLVPYPNLNGIWTGEIISTYINPETNQPLPPINSTIKIRQTLLSISVKAETAEMDSQSISSGFIIDEHSKQMSLCYSYISTPKATVRHRSPIHPGTALLKIENNNKKLKGEYWTSRKTTGEMEFNKSKGKK